MNSNARFDETWQLLSDIAQATRMVPSVQRAQNHSLPLIIVSGFLGAGKTTLLNRLLTEPHGRRLAVLVNDFGRINIDAALIRSRNEDTINLENGCACCSLAGDLMKTLVDLVNRPELPDAVVIEASGVADPRGIAQVALANPALRLDGILTMVDGETMLDRAADPACEEIFHAQISSADMIFLNKLDLLSQAQASDAHAWLASKVSGKEVVDTVNAEVPSEIILGIHSPREMPRDLASTSDHSELFQSWSETTDDILDGARFRAMMTGMPDGLLRAKGILWLADKPQQSTLYQRVGSRWRFSSLGEWKDQTPSSRLVLIGRKGAYNPAAVTRQFLDCRIV